MRDGIVNETVYKRYVNEIIHFLEWVGQHHQDWLTPFYQEHYNETFQVRGKELKRKRR